MPGPFPPDELARLEAVQEIEVETRASASGEPHRTIVWIVVADGEAYLRSYRGPGARWYREALGDQPIRLHVDGRAVDVTLEPAVEPAAIEAVSRGFERKYAGDPATPAMVRPEVLSTTLRARPA